MRKTNPGRTSEGAATRLRILMAIQHGHNTKRAICQELGMSENGVKHQLEILEHQQQAKRTPVREGRKRYYVWEAVRVASAGSTC